jgi:hypothetical protein
VGSQNARRGVVTRRAPSSVPGVLVRLLALAAAVFAVHAPPAGRAAATGEAPLAGAPGQRLQFRLPDGFTASPGRPGIYDRPTAFGPARCRSEARVTALASDRGVRFDPASSTLVFRLGGRRSLRVAQRSSSGERETWRTAVEGLAVGTPPAEGIARFPLGDRAVLVRLEVFAFADTTSPVQRTPETLGTCSRRARRAAPALLDAVLGSAEVTSARRGAP